MEERKKIDAIHNAKEVLREAGYFVDNLWSIDDEDAPQPAQNATTHADQMRWWCKWRGSYNVELINRISQIKKQLS